VVLLPANTNVVVATMAAVPPGSYVFMAKTTLVQGVPSGGASPDENTRTRCSLNGNPQTPTATDDFADSNIGRGDAEEVGRATLHTHVTANLASTTNVTLTCRHEQTNTDNRRVYALETKIIRIHVGTTTRTALP
jgi:hypothetical protein